MTTLDTPPAQERLQALRRELDGELLLPDDPGYAETVSPYNLAVTPAPAAVVRVRSTGDVATALRHAARAGLPVAVQSTGHGISTDLAGALLVHTGLLDECVVHAGGWARVGAGVRWSRVLEEAAPHGLAPLCGSAPSVGVVGLLTGGGAGPLARTYGASSDHVRAFEVVTGDGVLRRVTAVSDPDLFWGLRGGKGSLGIVTAVEIDLLPLATVYGGALFFAAPHAREVLHTWRGWAEELPEQATTSVALLQLPEMPEVPEPLAGRYVVAVRFVWAGDPARGEALLAPLRAVAEPVLDTVQEMPYAAIGTVHADPEEGMPAHESSELLAALPAEAVDALLAVAGPDTGSPQLVVEVRQLGGAFARGAEDPSALCHRAAPYSLLAVGLAVPPLREAVTGHADALFAAMAPWGTGTTLPNFACGSPEERVRRCYDATTLARLTELADRYDPHHLLRVGHVPTR